MNSSRARGVGGMGLAGLAALGAACASGGGTPPLTGTEAEALFASLTGVWVLDESVATRGFKVQLAPGQVGEIQAETLEGARQEAARMHEETIQRVMAGMKAIMEVFVHWPSTLILRVDEERLVYVPTPGQGMEMPMSGEWIIRQHLESPVPGRVPGRGRYTVRTRVYWDGDRLALEHRAKAGGQVRAVLEIVDGRLQVTRSLRDSRIAALAPLVLVFDRDGGGE